MSSDIRKIGHTVLSFFLLMSMFFTECARTPYYFCTAADRGYFAMLLNLVGGIHKHHFEDLGEIAVFDLGLDADQKAVLQKIAKLKIYEVEKKHPDILKGFQTTVWGKMVPGWYAWKPVIIKQALDMFPAVLYIDAGTTLLKPIDAIFSHMEVKGYFLHNGSAWVMKKQICDFPIKTFGLWQEDKKWILEVHGLEAGLQGLTRQVYDAYVMPVYECVSDLRNFADDGTAQGGWGACRHDLSVFSTQALLLGLKIHHHFEYLEESFLLEQSKGDFVPFHIACVPDVVSEKTAIYCSRNDIRNFDYYCSYIVMK